ncbi:MAG: peptide chain release factor N(5)-glutamine methyltransferase [Ectothiorhodospiraceae bacterium]|nr:peptide chain release factor N(5)-glutamine methyltransferase [Ectothiorhodospiraceae bacterium]
MNDGDYADRLALLEQRLTLLPDKPDETPESTLRYLWLTAAGVPVAVGEPVSGALPELDAPARERLQRLIAQRVEGVPLAHLVGRQLFMGLPFRVSRSALVPRRETEILARAALERLAADPVEAPLVVDLCTGCGNLALTVAHRVPGARVYGSDLSPEAVALATKNARELGCEQVRFLVGDLAGPFDQPEFHGQVDLLLCNPPYISTGKVNTLHPEIAAHEPRLAFDGGPFGVGIVQRLITEAPRLLRPGGWLLFEVGLGQGELLARRLARNPAFDQVVNHPDDNGDVRALGVRKRSGP